MDQIELISLKDFLALLETTEDSLEKVYEMLTSVSIAGVSVFAWLIGFTAFGIILSVIVAWASGGNVSMPGAAIGAAESIRQSRAERADTLLQAHRQTESYYQSLLRKQKKDK